MSRSVVRSEIGILFDVMEAHERVGGLLRMLLAPLGLTPSEYAVLSLLITTGPATHKELGARLGVTRSTLSGLLGSMGKKSLIERQPVRDGRSAMIIATDQGSEVHRRAQRVVRKHWTERQDPEALASAKTSMRWLIDRLGAAQEGLSPSR